MEERVAIDAQKMEALQRALDEATQRTASESERADRAEEMLRMAEQNATRFHQKLIAAELLLKEKEIEKQHAHEEKTKVQEATKTIETLEAALRAMEKRAVEAEEALLDSTKTRSGTQCEEGFFHVCEEQGEA